MTSEHVFESSNLAFFSNVGGVPLSPCDRCARPFPYSMEELLAIRERKRNQARSSQILERIKISILRTESLNRHLLKAQDVPDT